MKKIALTMLRTFEKDRDEWRNAIDERWLSFLTQCGFIPIFLPNSANSAKDLLIATNPNGVILTGGGTCVGLNGNLDPRDETETAVLEWAQEHDKPVLGVCRGMQVLLTSSGVRLEKVSGHVASNHAIDIGSLTRKVNSYHNYGTLSAPGFNIVGKAKDGNVEWIENKDKKLQGIMWHPEREKPHAEADIQLIQKIFLGE